MTRIAPIALTLFLAACGAKSQFIITAPEATTETRVRVASIEVITVSLPAYAAAAAIVVEDASGALRPVAKSLWADDPPRGVTAALARSLDVKSTATVAVEPWPLNDAPEVRLEVRVDEMLARADGSFVMNGQFALSSQTGAVRDRLQRFAIVVPLADPAPASVAAAAGKAIDWLADQILAQLKR